MKTVIGEKVRNAFNVILVAVPKNIDECIRISDFPLPCVDAEIYYSDNTMERLDSYKTMMSYMTKEYAKNFIPFYKEEMRLTVVYLASPLIPGISEKDYQRTVRHMYKKLDGMTAEKFLNGRY